jgi:hypothetical protein
MPLLLTDILLLLKMRRAHNTRTAVQVLGFVALLVGLMGPPPSGSEVDSAQWVDP